MAHAPSPSLTVTGDAGRIVVIDILRGLAILWVIVFHLWLDMTLGLQGVSPFYDRLFDRVREGDVLASLTAATDVLMCSGYQGVAVFMILSGLSLVMNAELRGEPALMRGWRARGRKLLVPYWGGVLFVLGVFAAIAVLQSAVDGGSVRDQWSNVRIAVISIVQIDARDIAWALSVFGWIFRADQVNTPLVGGLWFVPLLLQYYAVYPLALRLLRRTGPWGFALIAVVVTVAARRLYYEFGVPHIEPEFRQRYLDYIFIFRGSEFFFGMSLGYLFVHRRDAVSAWVQSPFDIAGIVVFALLAQWAAVSIDYELGVMQSLQTPLAHLSLVLIALPLLFKLPGRLELSLPARALVALGVVSFAALIVNDGMRFVASFLRAHDTPGALWWAYLVLVYVPGGTLLAYPLARLFGILPKPRTAAARAGPEPAAPAPLPAAGG